jgi:DNA-binding IclR family transcriptional regulator
VSAPDRTTVLGKALLVLQAFTADDHGVTLAELVRRTGLPKTTTHRVVHDLLDARLLTQVDGAYHLGGRLFELGMLASLERTLMEVAIPFLEDLYERTHETVHLGVREAGEVVYVAKVTGHRHGQSPTRIGGRMPLHSTAIGKALLAYADDEERAVVLSRPLARLTARTITAPGRLRQQLDAVVETGVAFEYEESALGIVCVAAAVLDAGDRPVAAVSVAGPPMRFRPPAHTGPVKAAAAGIAATLARREAMRESSSDG